MWCRHSSVAKIWIILLLLRHRSVAINIATGLSPLWMLLVLHRRNSEAIVIGVTATLSKLCHYHDDVIKLKHFSRYQPFVRGIHRSSVSSPHTGQWRGAPMFSLICAWINGWVNNRKVGELRRRRAHYDITVMIVNDVTAASPRLSQHCEWCYRYIATALSTLWIMLLFHHYSTVAIVNVANASSPQLNRDCE